jgi:glycosyltransferase involved in cell wall biosynthesis
MIMPKISILTPVWNGLPHLKECVQSVLAQEFTDFEYLISDDGSSDGSRSWLAMLHDPRIRVFEQGTNLGIFGNLNFLFGKASAPVSQILCQDDYFCDPGALARIDNLWDAAPARVGFIRENWTDENSTSEIGRWGRKHLPALIEPEISDLIFFIFGCIAGNLSNISVRTRLIQEIGWFDQSLPYTGDYQFWCRAGRKVPFLLESSNLTFVRQHPGQASFHLNRHGELVPQLYAVVRDLFDRLKSARPVGQLRLHATIQFEAFQRSVAIRHFLATGDRKYMRRVVDEADRQEAFLPALQRWLVFMATGGGRWGSSITARRLLAKQIAHGWS